MSSATLNPTAPTSRTSPTGPCLCSAIKGYFSFEDGSDFYSRSSRYALVNGFYNSLRVFDAHGLLWRVDRIDTEQRLTWLTKVLARTVYNPCIQTTVVWAEPVKYGIDELKAAYTRAVELDDDSLTQFVDGQELRNRIAACSGFNEVVAVYEWAGTDHDE